jgi:hypothetical protein
VRTAEDLKEFGFDVMFGFRLSKYAQYSATLESASD